MHNRTLLSAIFLIFGVRSAEGADVITINHPQALLRLATELSERYGYLVTYEDAPVDEREVVTQRSPRGGVDRFAVSKPVTFHIPTGRPLSADTQSGSGAEAEGVLPLSRELLQPMIDAYNVSGNPSRFAVSFDGTYAHIYVVSHNVNGRTEEFEPISATRVTMPSQPTPCYQTLNYLYAELKKMRNVDVTHLLIAPNWLFRRECTITGDNLTAGDVLAQIAHEFGSNNGAGPVEPGKELRITWWLAYDIPSGRYFLSMGWVADKARGPVAVAKEGTQGQITPAGQSRPTTTHIGEDGQVLLNPAANP